MLNTVTHPLRRVRCHDDLSRIPGMHNLVQKYLEILCELLSLSSMGVLRVLHAVILQYTSYRDYYPCIIGCSINLSVVAVTYHLVLKVAELSLWKICHSARRPQCHPLHYQKQVLNGGIKMCPVKFYDHEMSPQKVICVRNRTSIYLANQPPVGGSSKPMQQNIHLPLHLFEALSQDNLPGDHCPPLSRKSPTWELQWTVTIAAGEDQHTHQPKHL